MNKGKSLGARMTHRLIAGSVARSNCAIKLGDLAHVSAANDIKYGKRCVLKNIGDHLLKFFSVFISCRSPIPSRVSNDTENIPPRLMHSSRPLR